MNRFALVKRPGRGGSRLPPLPQIRTCPIKAPGPLAARVECVCHRLLSAQALTPLLGEGRARQLQDEVGPALCRHLLVAGAPDGAGREDSGRPAGAP
jgi:hypothetical protein